jgi:hypothetical protein
MPRSSGTYTLPAGNPVVTGTTITSTWANTTFSDVATALTGSVATDGTSGMTGILQMGNNKITGVADGTAASDVATVNQISNPTITGGTIDGAPIGAANPKNGAFLALSASTAAFSGTSTAPTVTPSSDNSTKIATTAFVQSAISAISSGVTTFNTRSGNVTLISADVTTALGYTPYNAGGATVITTSNYTTYTVTKTGTGASGTWGISISGNAATASTATSATSATTATTASGLTGSPAITVSSVTSSGNVQAYSGSNYAALQAQSLALFNSTTGMSCDGTTYGWQFSGSLRMQLNSSGQAYNTTGTWGTISDARIKENITPARDYLNDVCQLEVVNYYIKDEPQKMLGFVAQQVETVMPGLVETSDNKYYNISDFKSVKTTVLIPMLVQAIQELKATVDVQSAKIAALESAGT